MTHELSEVSKLVLRIRPILQGHPGERQGAVLAELLAIWLAGHLVTDEESSIKRSQTDMHREMLLDHTVDAARELIPMFEEHILDARKRRK